MRSCEIQDANKAYHAALTLQLASALNFAHLHSQARKAARDRLLRFTMPRHYAVDPPVRRPHDHDADPVKVEMPHTGLVLDMSAFSRNREIHADSSFSVLG
jgi:hypothetical protein